MRGIPGVLYLLGVIFLLALVIRIYPLQPWNEWDESVYLIHAEHLVNGKSNYDEFIFRPPILPIIIAGGFLVWHHVYVAAILIALLTSTIVIAMYLLGKRLHSEQAGLFAALIVAVHPLFVRFGHLIFTDALVCTFLAFSLYFALDDRWLSLAASGALVGLAALTKFSGLAAIPFLLAFIALNSKRVDRKGITQAVRRTAIAAAGVALVLAPYLTWAKLNYGSFVGPFTHSAGLIQHTPHSGWFYLHPQLFTIPLLLGLALFTWSWRSWIKDREIKRTLILTLAFSTFTLLTLSTFPYKHVRYGLLGIVLLVLFAGIGYAMVQRQARVKLLWAVFILIIIGFSWFSFTRLLEPPVSDWKYPAITMAERIIAHNNPGWTIYAASDYPFYGFYTNHTVVAVDYDDFAERYPSNMPDDGYFVVMRDPPYPPNTTWADAQPNLKRLFEDNWSVIYEYKAR